ncbi:hypothetical protein H0H93_013526 [Arthromyces matolae]|nr:hypothetical protein H0H93_013526 [Arthromyces matolae]
MKKLQQENYALKREIKAGLVYSRSLPYESQIKNSAEHYTIFYQLWADETAFKQRRPIPYPTLRGVQLPTKELEMLLYKACIINELYICVPLEFHHHLEESSILRDAFLHQMTSYRYFMAITLEELAPDIFASLDLPSTIWAVEHDRSKDPLCLALLSTEAATEHNLCPVLYLDPNVICPTEVFQNSSLLKIARVLLFGPGSLQEGAALTPDSSSLEWGAITVTAGLIAASATMAVYLLSGDKEFVACGEKTSICYDQAFRQRKQYIEQMSSNQWMEHIFATWNVSVFDGAPDDIRYMEESQTEDEQVAMQLATIDAIHSGLYGQPQPLTEEPKIGLQDEHHYMGRRRGQGQGQARPIYTIYNSEQHLQERLLREQEPIHRQFIPQQAVNEAALELAQKSLARAEISLAQALQQNDQLRQELILLKMQPQHSQEPEKTVKASDRYDPAKVALRNLVSLYNCTLRPVDVKLGRPPTDDVLDRRVRFNRDRSLRPSLEDIFLAEIYMSVPETFHEEMKKAKKSDELVRMFSDTIKNRRGNIISAMRSLAGEILQLDPTLFCAGAGARRATDPGCIGFASFQKAPSTMDRIPPFLFPQECRVNNSYDGFLNLIFQGKELFYFIKGILFGEGKATEENVVRRNMALNKTFKIISFESLPMDTIPVYAVLMMYIISPDDKFEIPGSVTKLDWHKQLEYLILQMWRVCYGNSMYNEEPIRTPQYYQIKTLFESVVLGISPQTANEDFTRMLAKMDDSYDEDILANDIPLERPPAEERDGDWVDLDGYESPSPFSPPGHPLPLPQVRSKPSKPRRGVYPTTPVRPYRSHVENAVVSVIPPPTPLIPPPTPLIPPPTPLIPPPTPLILPSSQANEQSAPSQAQAAQSRPSRQPARSNLRGESGKRIDSGEELAVHFNSQVDIQEIPARRSSTPSPVSPLSPLSSVTHSPVSSPSPEPIPQPNKKGGKGRGRGRGKGRGAVRSSEEITPNSGAVDVDVGIDVLGGRGRGRGRGAGVDVTIEVDVDGHGKGRGRGRGLTNSADTTNATKVGRGRGRRRGQDNA